MKLVTDFRFSVDESPQDLHTLNASSLPELGEVTVDRYVTETDTEFYEWAMRVFKARIANEVVESKREPRSMRIVKKRRWIWPRIWDCYDVREKDCKFSKEDSCISCEFEFARMEPWPWYKSFGWWIADKWTRFRAKENNDGQAEAGRG